MSTQSIDAKTFALITMATLFFVEVSKGFLPKLLSGKEAKLAMLLPVVFTVVAKLAGWFSGTDWVEALMWAFGGGAASGVAHDKLLDPARALISSILPKKPPAQ